MPTYKTPDVYVEEISVFPPSVAEVESAIPAFIGYTEQAKESAADDLLMKPTKIYSFKEYETLYGFPKQDTVAVTVESIKNDSGVIVGYKPKSVTEPDVSYLLYYAVQMYFENGGGKCYIVSVGNYSDQIALSNGTKGLRPGLDLVAQEDEPTLLVIPEATKLGYADYKSLSQAMLDQCGKLRDRFAILDVWNGDKKPGDDVTVPGNANPVKLIAANRDAWGDHLKYGAAYYPFLRTTFNYWVVEDETAAKSNVTVAVDAAAAADLMSFKTSNTALYNVAKTALKDYFVKMPPSGAVTGVYAKTDTERGVWKAPANVAVADVLEPLVKLDNALQDDLNVDVQSRRPARC